MSNKIQNGKVPLAQKTKVYRTEADLFGDPLSINPELKAYFESKSLAYRWIDYQKVVSYGGAHERHWRPIPRKECVTVNALPTFGNDAEGYFRSGSLVLAVRPQSLSDAHKQLLEQKAQRLKGIQKSQAEELRQQAKSQGIAATITEGYDEN